MQVTNCVKVRMQQFRVPVIGGEGMFMMRDPFIGDIRGVRGVVSL